MEKRIKKRIIWGLPCFLTGVAMLLRWWPAGAEWYACFCYPVIAGLLSAFSSLFSFSIGDCFIAGACLWLIIYPLYAWRRRKSLGWISGKMIRFLLWIYVWFYFAWGINYFRLPFYERAGVERAAYSSGDFEQFLDEYTEGLLSAYRLSATCVDGYTENWKNEEMIKSSVEAEVTRGYQNIAGHFKLVRPDEVLASKWMLWSAAFSRVGVTGYMGPFFAEYHLNRELLNVEYPFTYAHELAHRLGVAGEAEANLYAYLVTTGSSVPEIRFSGYFSLLGYVVNNARRMLSEDEYRALTERIPAEVVEMYGKHVTYWRSKYHPALGKIQNKVYNAYLKSNRISSGTKNYSEVIGLLMSLRHKWGLHENIQI